MLSWWAFAWAATLEKKDGILSVWLLVKELIVLSVGVDMGRNEVGFEVLA